MFKIGFYMEVVIDFLKKINRFVLFAPSLFVLYLFVKNRSFPFLDPTR